MKQYALFVYLMLICLILVQKTRVNGKEKEIVEYTPTTLDQ